MDEKGKLYVFAKKEVFLIFVFMILTAVSSFVLGVKIGKEYSFTASGYTESDRNRIELKSNVEEKVDQMMKDEPAPKEVEDAELKKSSEDALKKEIMQELSDEPQAEAPSNSPSESGAVEKKDNLSGKYTIQLSSHRTLEEAEKFAGAFKSRGYNPIINEVAIEGRGNWYRVSLGVFDNLSQAKAYIVKEQTLLKNEDYQINRFD